MVPKIGTILTESADALSCVPHGKSIVLHTELEAAGNTMKMIQEAQQEAQREDQQLLQLMEYLECQTLPEDPAVARQVTSQVKRSYYVLDGVLYFEDSIMPGWRSIVVPAQLRKQVLLENHEAVLAGHFTPSKLMQHVSQYYY